MEPETDDVTEGEMYQNEDGTIMVTVNRNRLLEIARLLNPTIDNATCHDPLTILDELTDLLYPPGLRITFPPRATEPDGEGSDL